MSQPQILLFRLMISVLLEGWLSRFVVFLSLASHDRGQACQAEILPLVVELVELLLARRMSEPGEY
jgi:hypothetical protein